MSKHSKKATALEKRLAQLAGSDGEDDETRDDFVALSKNVKKKLQGSKREGEQTEGDAAAPSGVVYVGHVPHGFFEEQMKGFFSQFGEIKQLRLSRSTKTARSRGYAYVEFAQPDVAQVVAETMNGYYLSGRKLVCEVLPKDKVHPRMFVGANRKFQKVPWRKRERERQAAPKTEAGASRTLGLLLKSEKKKREKLSKLGIDYEFPGYQSTADTAYVRRKRKLEEGKAEAEDGEVSGKPAKRGKKGEDDARAKLSAPEPAKEEGQGADVKPKPKGKGKRAKEEAAEPEAKKARKEDAQKGAKEDAGAAQKKAAKPEQPPKARAAGQKGEEKKKPDTKPKAEVKDQEGSGQSKGKVDAKKAGTSPKGEEGTKNADSQLKAQEGRNKKRKVEEVKPKADGKAKVGEGKKEPDTQPKAEAPKAKELQEKKAAAPAPKPAAKGDAKPAGKGKAKGKAK